MTIIEAKHVFLSSPPAVQASVLARYAWWITIHARGTYEAGTQSVLDSCELRRANEMMHALTEHIYKLLNGDAQRFPDVVFLDMIVQDKQRLVPHDAFIDAVALESVCTSWLLNVGRRTISLPTGRPSRPMPKPSFELGQTGPIFVKWLLPD